MRKAPDFSLLDQHGKQHTLKDYAGSWLVVYFYPKDATPGCTAQACSFKDGRHILKEHNVSVVGVSKDTVKSHAKFAKKYQLDFPVLSDESTQTIQAFGSWKPKKFMGKEFLGISRDTYLVNPEGEIVKKYPGVNPKTHFEELITDIKKFQNA